MTKFIKCQFSGNPNSYTYAVSEAQLKDAKLGDWLVVPAGSTNQPKVVEYLGIDNNPNKKIPYKWVIQFVNRSLLEAAISKDPVYATENA